MGGVAIRWMEALSTSGTSGVDDVDGNTVGQVVKPGGAGRKTCKIVGVELAVLDVGDTGGTVLTGAAVTDVAGGSVVIECDDEASKWVAVSGAP